MRRARRRILASFFICNAADLAAPDAHGFRFDAEVQRHFDAVAPMHLFLEGIGLHFPAAGLQNRVQFAHNDCAMILVYVNRGFFSGIKCLDTQVCS